ncbi:MAG TPA: hypothetical protein PLU72_01570 [Candidatus Ozemobacteraceae bacterium]|nr:hypothetical protein [Candidatus Ozemobacteraceae bacterium]HQG29223.1 hypothetical protein [Candidatus Ozemobacteraceae bacterium]
MSEKQELAAQLRMLIGEMRNAGFAELEIESADLNVRMVLGSAPASAPAPSPDSELPGKSAEDAAPKPVSVTAERVGVFSFGKQRIEAGSKVSKGQALGIIKGISIQDQVVAPVSGTVDAVFVREGEIIDFGRALFSILPD